MEAPSSTAEDARPTNKATSSHRARCRATHMEASAKSMVNGMSSIIARQEGFSLEGLNPLERHSAGIACWYTGPKVAEHVWPDNKFYGSYIEAGYGTDDKMKEPYSLNNNTNLVINNTDGSIVGYKYFNFSQTNSANVASGASPGAKK